jgi:AraC-like DNA-binding protein
MREHQNRFVLGLLAYAVQRDISAEQLCNVSGIKLSALVDGTHPLITAKQTNDLWMNACHLARDPLFGLHFGESLQLAALGTVGEIIKSSATVSEAVDHAAAMTSMVTDLFRMEVQHKKKTFMIKLVPQRDDDREFSFAFKQMTDVLMVFTVHELNGLLLKKIAPLSVNIGHTISDAIEYERVFRCKPDKKAGIYSLEFDNDFLNLPILTANYELLKLLLAKVHADNSSVLVAPDSWQVKIYNHVFSNAYLGILSLEEVAANFNMSSRNLQRKLQEEGITYQQLSDTVRKSLAVHYIAAGTYRIKEISTMLGYNELSAFSRAFKRWTGKNPANYQA